MRQVRLFRVLIVAILGGCSIGLHAQAMRDNPPQQREIAVTIDDLPLNGPRFDLKRLQDMTGRLLSGITKNRIPVVGFANESLLYVPNETDARIALLRAWSDAGVELGNHTFAHLGFRDTSLAKYEDDFIRGETVIRMLLKEKGQTPRYFRHPYLQMGPAEGLERSFESFIAERGYRIAPVTIDILDWMFRVAYANARTQRDSELMKRVSEEYLKFAALKFEFCERVTNDLFGHPIKQILLIHANELNADNLDRLVRMLKGRGYQLITLEQALKDPVYQFPDKYKDTSDWLANWSFSKGKQFESPKPPEFIEKIYQDEQRRLFATTEK
ncbi:MAG TPA: polysaccharide deacetylase family protein [Pyrinomonadaceae bacterium]|nr:polysaccharide deacetylase family protein [Pyrinomonadaceae bacterium]